MFGIFKKKKKKAPPPSIELSDDALDLIHGGAPPWDQELAPASTANIHQCDARDAVVSVVGSSSSAFFLK